MGPADVDDQDVHERTHLKRSRAAFQSFLSASLLEAMTAISSFQDLTNDFGPFVLELGGQGVDVDAGLGELGQHLLAVAAVRGQDRADLAVIGEGLQRGLGHRVHGERRGEGLDVQDVGGLGVLGSGAGPQQALRAGAGVVDALPARRIEQSRGTPCRSARRSAMPSWSRSALGHLARDRGVPAADEHRSHGADVGIQPGVDAPLDAAQVRLGGRHVLLAGEQQGHVDRHAGEDRLLDGGQAFLGAGNLDEQVGPRRPGVQFLGRGEGAGRVVGQQRRDLQRHPAVHAVGPVVDRPEQIGGLREVLERQLEEQLLARLAFLQLLADARRRRS